MNTNPAQLEAAALSDCGKPRPVNEDSYTSDLSLGLFAIADGKGGHGSVDVASELAISTTNGALSEASGDDDVTDTVLDAVT